MIKKLPFLTHFPFYFSPLFFILFFCSIDVDAQCSGNAGNDSNTLNICDIANVLSRNIDLNAQLGTHVAGGTWKDDDKSGGLNITTGILNAQQIKRSGIYNYTYSITNGSGCTDTAKVTVKIGGFSGIPGEAITICNDTGLNLFQLFKGLPLPSPQINGVWNDDSSSGGLSGNILDTSVPIPDNLTPYTYTYTVSSPIGSTCPPTVSSTVSVSILRGPESGIPTNLLLCSNQLAPYSNLNLNDQLSGEDSGGTWTEFGTSEISDETDSTIDIPNIYNTKGAGVYQFTYKVLSNNPTVCDDRSSTVSIIIEKQLDFTGAKLVVNSDICENEIPTATYEAVLTQGAQAIPNGTYEVTYSISGIGAPIKTTASFAGGILKFSISSTYFQQVNNYTVTINSIVDVASSRICNNIIGTIEDVLHVNPLPRINSATLTIDPVCQTFDQLVNFSGTSNLTDGSYNILYNISGSNTVTARTEVLNITGGLGSFIIPKALIPNAGTSTITITKITNSITGCTNASTLSKSFTVNPLPDATNLATAINNICQGQTASVKLSGLGTLTAISINYTLSGVNTVGSQTIPLTVVAGETNFVIPTTDIPNVGLTSFIITNLTNTLTGCSISLNKKTDFTVNPIPAIPVANDQKFCTSDNATVANLLPQGAQYKWYDSVTSTVPLTSSTALITGNYFVKEVNALTGCESSLKQIAVVINTTPQINNATLTIPSICQGIDAFVTFSGTSNLANGTYNILYNLSGSNTKTAIPATLNVTGGLATFSIASSSIPNSGDTTIAITNITNTLTNCTNSSTLSKVFVVNALPDVANMVVTVKDACLGQAANVDIAGLGNLNAINLSYNVSGANAIGSQTIPLVVSGGKTSFLIQATNLLNTGSNTLVITNITNASSCSAIFNPVSKIFNVNAIPNSPAASNQKFCETDAAVANLDPKGNQYKWYDSPTSTTPLASSKLLATGNYYVKETNATTACESISTPISVQVNTVQMPVLKPQGEEFCGVDKPTILNLSNNVTASVNLAWYDAAINGTILPKTDLLSEGATYYGFDYDTTSNCYSSPLAVTVKLTNCTVTPDGLKIPDGFSPNGDGVNDTFYIVDIEFSFPNYTLEIFNRYGNVLFKGDINRPAWDGKNSTSSFINGEAPAGVYFYIINYNKDNLPPRQGQVYLNR